jgi:hypothetical protein
MLPPRQRIIFQLDRGFSTFTDPRPGVVYHETDKTLSKGERLPLFDGDLLQASPEQQLVERSQVSPHQLVVSALRNTELTF